MGSAPARLRPVEAVRCLGCSKEYVKPSGRSTLAANPGCPVCGYVGWEPSGPPLTATSPRARPGEGHLLLLSSRSG